MLYGTVIGNLGSQAETKTLPSGKVVTNFSVATKDGKNREQTNWIRCAFWGERGKKVAEYLTKGRQVTIVGPMSMHEHNGKSYLECDVQELTLQGGGKDGSRPASHDAADDEPPPF